MEENNKSIDELKWLICNLKEKIDDCYIIKEYEPRILKLNNPNLCYWFCKYFPTANIKKHGEVVLNSQDEKYNLFFGLYIKGANKELHEELLKKLSSPCYGIISGKKRLTFEINQHLLDNEYDKLNIKSI